MASEIEKLKSEYAGLLKKSYVPNGTPRSKEQQEAFEKKAEVHRDLWLAEKAEANKGKRSLQEEYVRKFDNEVPVEIKDKSGKVIHQGTLQEFHAKRLLGK